MNSPFQKKRTSFMGKALVLENPESTGVLSLEDGERFVAVCLGQRPQPTPLLPPGEYLIDAEILLEANPEDWPIMIITVPFGHIDGFCNSDQQNIDRLVTEILKHHALHRPEGSA